MKTMKKELKTGPQESDKCILCGRTGDIQFKGRLLCRGCLEYVKETYK